MDKIEELLAENSQFNDKEKSYLRQMTDFIPHIANVSGADVFIDIPLVNGNALVLAEAKPTTAKSLYHDTVVGLVADSEQEPGVAKVHRDGLPVMESDGVSQEGIQLRQNVVPLYSPGSNKVIGSLILERDITSLVAEQKAREEAEKAETMMQNVLRGVNQATDDVKRSIDNMTNISQELAASAEEIAATHEGLSQNSQEIQKQLSGLKEVLTFIDQVSSKTHLLGLNAAIESARLSSMQHGFNVIASEIRKLASHVKDSAGEIGTVVAGLLSISSNMFEEIRDVTKATEIQAMRLQDLSEQMVQVNDATEDLISVMNQ